MDELTPIYRVEFFLDAIVNNSENPYAPIHRIEYYLAKIAGEDVEIPTPIYRIEYYLAKIAGEDVEIPSPIYRAEFYLAALCGEEVDVPEPLFRIEYWLAEWVEKGTGYNVTVRGLSPLALVNSLAHAIRSLTQYGKCVQDGTPTPDAPVDILCNNGALRYGKPLTLDPTRYYAYISTSNTWSYSTDSYSIVMPVTVGKKYKITADPTTPIDGGVVNVILRWGFVDTVYDDWKQSAVAPSSTSVTIYDWVRSTPQDTQSVEVTATRPFMVIQMGAAAFASNLANGRIGVAVQEVYTDGTPEVLTISGINLLAPSTSNIIICESVNAQGQSTTAVNNWRTDYIPVVGGKTYIFYGRRKSDDAISAYSRMNFYKSDKTAITPRPSYTQDTPSVATAPPNAAYVRLSCAPINSQNTITRETFDAFNWMFAEAAQEIPYEPYVTPQTVTDIPMLLSTGADGIDDEEEFISGSVTHRVGIKVFDGTETFTVSSSGAMITAIPDVAIGAENTPMNTHFALESSATSITVGKQRFGANGTKIYSANYYMKHATITTAADFKAWLAAQYTAGTPVIMLYPLATETTEQTTPHSLHTVSGTTIVDAQTNVDPVELACEYYASQAPNMLFGGLRSDNPSEEDENPVDEAEEPVDIPSDY